MNKTENEVIADMLERMQAKKDHAIALRDKFFDNEKKREFFNGMIGCIEDLEGHMQKTCTITFSATSLWGGKTETKTETNKTKL